jgi:hypothetical protein
MRKLGIVAALLAVLLTGCGSTVPLGAASGDPSGDGLTAPTGIPGQSTVGPSGDALPAPPSATSGALPSGSAAAVDLSTPTRGTSTRSQPAITIGSYYLEGGTAALAAAGFGGLAIPDNKPLLDAMVRYLNKHGGLGGRQIKLIWFKYVSGGDPQAQDAAACATFTQDHHAFLVLGGINSGAGELAGCLTRKGVPLIGANAGGDARYFAANHRFVYEPGQASFTRGLSTLVSSLAAQGWFKGAPKVGVVQYEGASYEHAVDDGLVRPLAALGLKVAERVRFAGVDNGVIASGSANAVLRFRTAGVNRVVFMGPGGAAATYFMTAASTQGWHPEYGIWSADSPYVLAITAPGDQLLHSSGIGYQPGLDVASEQDPTARTPAAKKCLAFWDSVGITDHSALNGPLQRAFCDITNTLLRAVAADRNATYSTAALEAAYDSIGRSYSPAGAFAITFRSGSHDAASGYRRLAYEARCKCFSYVGGTLPLQES